MGSCTYILQIKLWRRKALPHMVVVLAPCTGWRHGSERLSSGAPGCTRSLCLQSFVFFFFLLCLWLLWNEDTSWLFSFWLGFPFWLGLCITNHFSYSGVNGACNITTKSVTSGVRWARSLGMEFLLFSKGSLNKWQPSPLAFAGGESQKQNHNSIRVFQLKQLSSALVMKFSFMFF